MQKNFLLTLFLSSCLRYARRRSVSVSQSNMERAHAWMKIALLKGRTLMKVHGRRRWRPSFADFGCKDFNAKTRWKSRVAALLTDRRNFKRKRPLADNTLHQFVRISWSTQVNAPMEQDAFSSTQLKMSEPDNPTRIWSRIISDTPRWGFSRRLKGLTCFTSTHTPPPPQDSVLLSPFATMQRINTKRKWLKRNGLLWETLKSQALNPSWSLLPNEQLVLGRSPVQNIEAHHVRFRIVW